MCLTRKVKVKVSTKGHFYVLTNKIFDETWRSLFNSKLLAKKGKWLDAKKYLSKNIFVRLSKKDHIYTRDLKNKYHPYFHVFTSLKDAKTYYKYLCYISKFPYEKPCFVKCKIRNVVACGYQDTYIWNNKTAGVDYEQLFVVVARYRKIVGESEEQ